MLDTVDLQLSPGTVTRPLTDHTRIALVHCAPATCVVSFVRRSDLAAWGVTDDEAWQAAEQSFSAIVAATRVELSAASGSPIGMLHAHEPYKASMILSPALKAQVPAELGWPVYAVVPARDFVFLFRRDDASLIDRLGGVLSANSASRAIRCRRKFGSCRTQERTRLVRIRLNEWAFIEAAGRRGCLTTR